MVWQAVAVGLFGLARYVVSDRKIGVEVGIFVTSTRELRVADIRSIEIRRRGLAGLFGIGDVELSSAARDDASVAFAGILETEDVADLIREIQDGATPAAIRGEGSNFGGLVGAFVFAVGWTSSVVIFLMSQIPHAPESSARAEASSSPRAAVVGSPDPARVITPRSSVSRPVYSATPAPRQTPLPSTAFLADVAYSQQTAVAKYPSLAVAGSPLNKAFIARLAAWKLACDPRLDRSDWPVVLAGEWAAER